MLSFFNRKPTLPISFDEQIWIEDSFIWLISEFGYDVLKRHSMLSTKSAEFLLALNHPDGYAEGLLRLVCNRMAVKRTDIDLRSYSTEDRNREVAPGLLLKHEGGGAAGVYQQLGSYFYRISYDQKLENDPEALAAVLAHEVGHILLLGEQRMSGHEDDHEFMTDFVSLYFGFGVLAANSMHREFHTPHSWSSVQQGYFSMPMYSFALALVTWLQTGTAIPNWFHGMRLNAKSWFKKSLTYLHKTGNSSIYSQSQSFDATALPEEVLRIKKRLKLAVLLEDYSRAASLKSYLEEDFFTKRAGKSGS